MKISRIVSITALLIAAGIGLGCLMSKDAPQESASAENSTESVSEDTYETGMEDLAAESAPSEDGTDALAENTLSENGGSASRDTHTASADGDTNPDGQDAEGAEGAEGVESAESASATGRDDLAEEQGASETESPDQAISRTESIPPAYAGSGNVQEAVQAEVSGQADPATRGYETGYILMGDSRFSLLNEDCDINSLPNFFVVCCPCMGYHWMISSALPQAEAIETAHPEIENWIIVSGFGINDLDNISSYLRTYKSLAADTDLRLLSVNPTMGQTDPQYSNSSIEAFNKKLKKLASTSLSIKYIDCYNYLTQKGYWMTDGIHYNTQSNWDILAFLLESICPETLKPQLSGQSKTDREAYAKKLLEVMSTPKS